MKKILFTWIFLLLTYGSAISQIPTLVPGWPYRSKTLHFGKYVLGRFADEGSEKHLFYDTMMGDLLKFNLDGSFSNGWPINCDSIYFSDDPVIFDIDHDGRFEMLTEGSSYVNGVYVNSLIYLVDDNGTVMPGFPITAIDPVGFAAADMDNDNEYEIIYFSWREGIINCIDRYGNSKPGWPIPIPYDIACVAGSFGDLDLDGNNEYIITGYRNIYAFRYDGTIMSGFPVSPDTDFAFYNGIWGSCLADVDQDGYPEIITAANNWFINPQPVDTSFVAIYDHTGRIKPGWPKYYSVWIMSPVTPFDIENNGSIELSFQDLYLHLIELDGTELPGWPILLTGPNDSTWISQSDLIATDINGDGYCELFPNYDKLYADSMGQDSVWHYGFSYFYAYNHLGQLLPNHPFVFRGSNAGKPPCFSLDRSSNKLYMSLSSDVTISDPMDSSFLSLYQYPDSTGPPDQWPMLSHDNLHTRNYSFIDRVTSIADEGSPPLPRSAILKQNYPNPFNSSTKTEFILPKEEHVTLSMYDVVGRKIRDIANGVYSAGSHTVNITLGDRASGIYYLALNAEDTHINRKLVLVK